MARGIDPAPKKKRKNNKLAMEYGPFRDPKTVGKSEVMGSLRKINPNIDAAVDRIRRSTTVRF